MKKLSLIIAAAISLLLSADAMACRSYTVIDCPADKSKKCTTRVVQVGCDKPAPAPKTPAK
jgi:hypothetical protein